MTSPRLLIALVAVLLTFSGTPAQYEKTSAVSPAAGIFPVSQLREGMRGTAKTVFRGNTPEEFNVEILGVLPNWIGPKQDLIVGKLSGANAERTFVFAGMSGSPVYIDGKLVGAISYSFPFAKEPICGITPFEQMVSSVERAPAPQMVSEAKRTFSYAELLGDKWTPDLTHNDRRSPAPSLLTNPHLAAIAAQTFRPISTPVTFAGISQKVLDGLADQFLAAGILPVAASGANSGSTKLKPATADTLLGGDSVIVHLTRGDVVIAAAGTVTFRDGNKIYAFGHPFFGLGSTSLPMSESHVVTVVPNANNSFKLSVPDSTVGSMTQDRSTGIYGMLGEAPKMMPIKVRLTTSRGKTEEINFESAVDPVLTPLIINAGVGNALSANERGFGDSTLELSGEITFNGEEPIRFQRRFGGPQAMLFTASAAGIPVGALLKADFEGLEITGITLDIKAADGSKSAVIDRLSVDRDVLRAGETVELTVYERAGSGRIMVQKVPITIPADTPEGPITVTVGDGGSIQQNSPLTQFVARNAADLIRTFNQLKRPDRLYAFVARSSKGAVVGSSEMPNLPPSMLATLNNERTSGGSKAAVQTVVSSVELPGTEYLVSGQQTLKLDVIR